MMSISNAFSLLLRGGPVMWPLFACAIISVAVIIERSIVITRAGRTAEHLLDQVQSKLEAGRIEEARGVVEQFPGSVAHILAAGLRVRDLSPETVERRMEESALRQTPALYKRLGVLDTIITLSPLLGLLGTVTGMIRSFHVVGIAGLNGGVEITGGIAEALIATATGLAIAIVTLIFYNYLTEKVKEIIADMEIRGTQLLNILAETRLPNLPDLPPQPETKRESA